MPVSRPPGVSAPTAGLNLPLSGVPRSAHQNVPDLLIYATRFSKPVARRVLRAARIVGSTPQLWSPTPSEHPSVGRLPYYPRPERFASTFALARRLADDWGHTLTRLLPGLSGGLIGEADLRPPCVVALTLKLGLGELPGIINFLDQTAAAEDVVLVNTPLAAHHLPLIVAALGPTRNPHRIRSWSIPAGSPAPQLLATGEATAPGHIESKTVAAVVFCGSMSEVENLQAACKAIRGRGQIVIVAKNDLDDCAKACAKIAVPEAGDMIIARRLWTNTSIPALDAMKDQVVRRIEALPPRHRVGLAPALRIAMAVLRDAADAQALLQVLRPDIIIGSFHRSTWGATIIAVRDPATRVVDLQHGTIIPFRISDLFAPDLLLAWNSASAKVLRSDSLPPSVPVEIVGNPRWQLLSDRSRRSSAPEPNFSTNNTGTVVGVFPQPIKGPLLSADTMTRWWAGLEHVLGTNPGVSYIIRPHPNGEDIPNVLASHPRVGVVSHTEMPLEEMLYAVDGAVSIYSTALADARAAGIPAISFDLDRILTHVSMDFAGEVIVCTTVQSLSDTVSKLMTKGEPIPRVTFAQHRNPDKRMAKALSGVN